MWVSFNDLKKGAYSGVSFPYVAKQLSTNKSVEYRSISDVYDEIIKLYDIAQEKGFNLGEALYSQLFFFTDPELLVDPNMQNRIKEYNYCKTFSCSAYPSLYETPADIVDDFLVIEEEYNYCMKKKQEESNA